MNPKDLRLLLEVIRELRKSKSWTGKTHVIKTFFLATACAEVESPFEFILYKHGPYSFDIEDALAAMQVYGFAAQEDVLEGYGRSFLPGARASQLEEKAALTKDERQAICRVSSLTGQMNVRELEGLATACWARTREGLQDDDEIARRVNTLKPHIPLDEARQRVRQLACLLQKQATACI